MCLRFLVLVLIGFLASCSAGQQTKEQSGWRSGNTAMIERTKELFACSNFFGIVASQRQKEKEKYSDLAQQAKDLGYRIMPTYKGSSTAIQDELTKKYTSYGIYTAHNWVRAIGKDQTGAQFPKITGDCYKTVQRESLFDTVDDLSEKLDQK